MAFKLLILSMVLAAPAAVAAQSATAPPPAQFENLWTSWSGVSRRSTQAESSALDRVRQDVQSAGAERRAELQVQGRELGERVGQIVRSGDCDDGERVARLAGAFALVEAVRAYCRGRLAETGREVGG